MTITRRDFCQSAATVVLASAAFGVSLSSFTDFAHAQAAPSVSELMQPGPLPEMAIGKKDAPVTIVEYASMTCGHCAHFATTTFPELKKKYIDTGKVYFVLREFPFDSLAAGAFMLSRCAAGDNSEKYFALVDTLFEQQRTWMVKSPVEPLQGIFRQAGLTGDAFDKCLANQEMLDKIDVVRKRGNEKFAVNATPTFFINGKKPKTDGALSFAALEAEIAPYLKGK